MNDDRAIRHAKMRERLAELKNEAFAQLERRGYEVRGKTTTEIRQILRRRPTKSKTIIPEQKCGALRTAKPTLDAQTARLFFISEDKRLVAHLLLRKFVYIRMIDVHL
jgi:hypothetical protein